jgi:ribonuclease P protein component
MQRLKTRTQFQAVLAAGTVARTPHFALHQLLLSASQPPAGNPPASSQAVDHPDPGTSDAAVQALLASGEPLLGAMTPKRWARRAVTRNAIRRQIHAVGESFASRLPCAAHVVRLRTGFDRKVYVSAWSEPLRLQVRGELIALFERAAALASADGAGTRP